ncbi:signal peptidase II [Blattabacterium cuenoti]|uniref:signal peptidase II n=1 Tax=Blattabacterium cuenoti TaxID=1653831 RepID=UPI00163C01BB|nr:signal peptidase II [Blattabacterium cuenoti]
MKKILCSISILSILIDQFIKIYVKTHFIPGSGIYIFSFFWIFFVENPGMAYGYYLLPGYSGKLYLSILRLIFIIIILSFIIIFYKKYKYNKYSNYLIFPLVLICSGSIGNFFDSALYGLLFNTGTIYNHTIHKWVSYSEISNFNNFICFNQKGGYASFMNGCVVDMFYLPIIDTYIPYNIPIIGGYKIKFFQFIFNFADILITLGIILLFFFKNKIKKIKFF